MTSGAFRMFVNRYLRQRLANFPVSPSIPFYSSRPVSPIGGDSVCNARENAVLNVRVSAFSCAQCSAQLYLSEILNRRICYSDNWLIAYPFKCASEHVDCDNNDQQRTRRLTAAADAVRETTVMANACYNGIVLLNGEARLSTSRQFISVANNCRCQCHTILCYCSVLLGPLVSVVGTIFCV